MKKLISLSALPVIILLGLFILNSCSEKEGADDVIDLPVYTGDNLDEAAIMEEVFTSEDSDLKCGGFYPEMCGNVKFYPLIASQRYFVGALMVYNDDENLYVTYWSGWWRKLSDFHLYIGTEDDLPLTKKGNPQFGHFPFKDEESVTGFKTFVIPLSEIPECYVMVAHANLCGHTVIAYGETPFWGQRWGWSIEDCVEECEEDEYDYYTLKLFYYDQNGNYHYALLELSEQDNYNGDWCDNMGIVQLKKEQSINLMFHGRDPKIGVADIIIENGAINSKISFDSDGSTPDIVYVFYGTLEELDSYGSCPNYIQFPFNFEGNNALEFSIPLN